MAEGVGEGWRIEPLEQTGAEELLALAATALGPASVPRTEAFWRWKHEEGPFGASAGVVARAGDGTLAGLRVFLRWRWRSGGREVEAVRAVDTATDPEWRRRGLFRSLTTGLVERVREERVALVFNTPNAKSRAGYLGMGWEDVVRVPLLVRVLRPGRLLGRLWRVVAGAEGDVALEGARPAAEVVAMEGVEELVGGAFAGEGRLHTPRTAEYLRWRYAAVPGIEYRGGWRAERGEGALVMARGRVRRGLAEVALAEVVASPGGRGEAAARAVVRELLVGADADYAVAVAARATSERRVLRRCGFIPVPWVGPYFTVRVLAEVEGVPNPRRWESWRLSLGDLEVF